MYQPVKTPAATLTRILIMLTALEPVLISPPSSDNILSLLPIKVGTRNFGEMMAVARPYMSGLTVGKVETAPLHSEYGKGHKRIMHNSFKPSYLRVNDKAANRLSCFISLCTNLDKTVRET